jgi:transposase-like protein
MCECKNCRPEKIVKSGKQRYKCKECGYNFVIGDKRTNEKIIALKALCLIIFVGEKFLQYAWKII